MPNASRLRRACAASIAALALLAAAPASSLATAAEAPAASVAAAPGQPDPGKGRATFGVRPATAKAPDSRPNFSYAATPGAVVKDFIAVSNIAETPVKLRVYASDAFNNREGGFDLLARAKDPVDVGAWVRMRATNVTIPARSVQIVPFTLSLPTNASPGDHVGGIVASLVTKVTGPKGQKVAVEQRVGARIYLRVSGPLEPALTVKDLDGSYDGQFFGRGKAKLSFTVLNSGNVRLGGKLRVGVSTPWGSTVDAAKLKPVPELLPGNSMRMTATVDELLPAGWLTGEVRVTPVTVESDRDLRVVPASGEVTLLAVPWPLLVLLVALAAGFFLLRWYRRRRAGTPVVPDTPQGVEAAETEAANA